VSPRSAPPTQTYTHVHAHAQARAHTHMHTRQKYLVALGVDWRRPLRAMEFRECTCGASACEATRTTKRFLCIHVYLSVSVCVSVRLYPYISIHSYVSHPISPAILYLNFCPIFHNLILLSFHPCPSFNTIALSILPINFCLISLPILRFLFSSRSQSTHLHYFYLY
jgi:hypothetical protein